MSKTKILHIVDLLKSGIKPIVQINNKIFEDCYLEDKMFARLINAKILEYGTEDEHVQYTFCYKEFINENRKLESSNYYNSKTGDYDLTATEIDYKHSDYRDISYQAMKDDEICFDIIENDLLNEFLNLELENQTYVEWLESLVKKHRK